MCRARHRGPRTAHIRPHRIQPYRRDRKLLKTPSWPSWLRRFSSTIVLVPDHSLSLFFWGQSTFWNCQLCFFCVRWTWNSYLENLIFYLVNKTRFGAQWIRLTQKMARIQKCKQRGLEGHEVVLKSAWVLDQFGPSNKTALSQRLWRCFQKLSVTTRRLDSVRSDVYNTLDQLALGN